LGEISFRNTCRPCFASSSLFSSLMEPEVSTTSMMLAGLRSSLQACLIRASTLGSGSERVRAGCLGSAPCAASTGEDALAWGSPGRKPPSAARSGVTSSSRNFPSFCAAVFCSPVTHGAFSTMYGLSEKNVPSLGYRPTSLVPRRPRLKSISVTSSIATAEAYAGP